jgi:hypothetical protein
MAAMSIGEPAYRRWMSLFLLSFIGLPLYSVAEVRAQEKVPSPEAAAKILEIKTLLKERHKILMDIIDLFTQQYSARRVDFVVIAQAQRDVLNVNLELFDRPEDRRAALERIQLVFVKNREFADAIFAAGKASNVDTLQAQAMVLEVQIELLKTQAKEMPSQAEKIQSLLKKRQSSCNDTVHFMTKMYETGRVKFAELAQVQREALRANLDPLDSPKVRTEAIENLQKIFLKTKEVADAMYNAGRVMNVDTYQAQAMVLEIQIELLNLKAKGEPSLAREIRALQKMRCDALADVVKTLSVLFTEGKIKFNTMTNAELDALRGILDIRYNPDDRIAVLLDIKALAEENQKIAEARSKAGAVLKSEVLLANAIVLEVRIALLREEVAKLEK